MVAWNHRPAGYAGRQQHFGERKILRALVLGGGGFIGSHLVAALLKQGDQVRVLERPYSPRIPLIPDAPGFAETTL
jgi:nucleoside-diphosphate-sugar epimerase